MLCHGLTPSSRRDRFISVFSPPHLSAAKGHQRPMSGLHGCTGSEGRMKYKVSRSFVPVNRMFAGETSVVNRPVRAGLGSKYHRMFAGDTSVVDRPVGQGLVVNTTECLLERPV